MTAELIWFRSSVYLNGKTPCRTATAFAITPSMFFCTVAAREHNAPCLRDIVVYGFVYRLLLD